MIYNRCQYLKYGTYTYKLGVRMVEVRFMLCYYTETGRRLQKALLLAAANFCNGNLLCEVKLLKDYSTSFAIGPFIYMYHIPHIFMTFFYQKQQLEIARYVLARQQYKIQYSLKKFFSKYYYRNTQVPNRYAPLCI